MNGTTVNAAQLVVHMTNPTFIMLMGLPASGKSTLGEALTSLGYDYFNADKIRGEIYGSEGIVGEFDVVYGLLRTRLLPVLDQRRNVVLDLTNLTPQGRREWIEFARTAGYNVQVLFLDVPLPTVLARNAARSRVVPEGVIRSMHRSLCRWLLPASHEAPVTIVRPGSKPGLYEIHDMASSLPTYYDIIGDVHGCYHQLLQLLFKLGYEVLLSNDPLPRVVSFTAPPGAQLVLCGDLINRGPHSNLVLNLLMQLPAIVVEGNHDDKYRRYLKGNPVQPSQALRATIAQVEAHGAAFQDRVRKYLSSLPLHFFTEDLVVVHAAYREHVSPEEADQLALYGEVAGTRDAHGRLVRSTRWESDYTGSRTIVHGHDPVPEVTIVDCASGAHIVNVDTGAPFGGKLSALRFPQMEIVQVGPSSLFSDRG